MCILQVTSHLLIRLVEQGAQTSIPTSGSASHPLATIFSSRCSPPAGKKSGNQHNPFLVGVRGGGCETMLSVEKDPWGSIFDKQPGCFCLLSAKELPSAFHKGRKIHECVQPSQPSLLPVIQSLCRLVLLPTYRCGHRFLLWSVDGTQALLTARVPT